MYEYTLRRYAKYYISFMITYIQTNLYKKKKIKIEKNIT